MDLKSHGGACFTAANPWRSLVAKDAIKNNPTCCCQLSSAPAPAPAPASSMNRRVTPTTNLNHDCDGVSQPNRSVVLSPPACSEIRGWGEGGIARLSLISPREYPERRFPERRGLRASHKIPALIRSTTSEATIMSRAVLSATGCIVLNCYLSGSEHCRTTKPTGSVALPATRHPSK
ncbi:uncharacterized protein LY79DRAFT_2955 [Colletotrichum navitas]|uniref:Uncharacterized protein n=1 Tax=Colletotrichum navitas TaxID=681940 RepID=A0AAD8QCN4_9PEZI|nr:uncharacterized protein LY79DRAFT_2955 [Colletotrichum navitas]KAK1599980.1 hypothetical protein LY79DRAFT_2955 [Colletotrichum navitas]